MRSCASWIVGIAATFGLIKGAHQLLGPVKCRDGWASPSIGSRGACSHHHGVSHARDLLLPVLIGGGATAGVAFYASPIGRLLDGEPPFEKPVAPTPPPAPPRIIPPQEGEIDCPKCGGVMRLRLARKGRGKGKHFWGCSQFPACNGTRHHRGPVLIKKKKAD